MKLKGMVDGESGGSEFCLWTTGVIAAEFHEWSEHIIREPVKLESPG